MSTPDVQISLAAKAIAAECPLCGVVGSTPFLTAPDRFHGRQRKYQLMRCNSCKGVWLVSPPLLEEMPVHYDNDYHRTIAEAGERNAEIRWQRYRKLISREKQHCSILDIGCSTGAFLSTLDRRLWNRYGIEIEATTAEKARKNTGAEIFAGDVGDAPFPDEHFDVITCFDLIEHVYSPIELLRRVHRWLKPGGFLCAVLPNIESWESRLFGTYWYGLELPRHLFHFSPSCLRHAANRLGFEEVRLGTRNSYIERSVGYLYQDIGRRLRAPPKPPCKGRTATLSVKAIRRLLRIGLITPFAALASAVGAGASIEVIFAKRVALATQTDASSDLQG